jgi:tRNA threonylcarbamoyladenosine biosynthesis protein TsaB
VLILAVDSSTPVAGVALLDENRVIIESFINYQKTHSETLLPTVDRILRECDLGIKDIDVLAVTAGPGSFTGLRIGMAMVKGISMASGKPVVAVSTLDTLAANLTGSHAVVGALLDARKNELYCGFYRVDGCIPEALKEAAVCSPEAAAHSLLELLEMRPAQRIILLGDGYYRYADYFDAVLKERLLPVPAHLMLPRAAAVGALALHQARRGEFDDIYRLRPAYIRLSEAEYHLGKGEL